MPASCKHLSNLFPFFQHFCFSESGLSDKDLKSLTSYRVVSLAELEHSTTQNKYICCSRVAAVIRKHTIYSLMRVCLCACVFNGLLHCFLFQKQQEDVGPKEALDPLNCTLKTKTSILGYWEAVHSIVF